MNEAFQLAIKHYKSGHLRESANICLAILDRDPNNFDALYCIGVILYQSKNYDKAIEIIEKAMQFKPNDTDIFNNFGDAFIETFTLKGHVHKSIFIDNYERVYPDKIAFDILGNKLQPHKFDINNFLSHSKFYKFTAQFVKSKDVADVGCGSGYGCEILKKAGALKVCGSDISNHAINFAKSRFGSLAEFSFQSITDLKEYPDNSFDIAISNEVLEHIKEYGESRVEKALQELKRITRDSGLIIIGTPNTEMLPSHGFSFDEISLFLQQQFLKSCIFENAIVPFGDNKKLWEKRLLEGRVGIIVSEHINLSETPLPEGVSIKDIKFKKGIEPGSIEFAGYCIDTTLLSNGYSWLIVAINNK